MKRIICSLCAVLLLLSLMGCGYQTVILDYADAAAFESALNAGEDLTGKTVRFTVDALEPDSVFGYNMWAGEHLNFCSSSNPKVSVGDTVTVKVKEVSSVLGSWIIDYTMLERTATATGYESPDDPIEEKIEQEPESNSEFGIGEAWTVDGQWTLTVDSVKEISDRNEFSEKNPAAVYIVSYTYTNIGYEDAIGIMDGLYFSIDDSIVDCTGLMGYSYPGDITDYPQETPVGATCKAQVCIGVDNAGLPIKLIVSLYDGNEREQKATFILK